MTRDAKLFEAGEYPDKKIIISEEDLSVYSANFVPCPVKIEHTDTAFDGVLGMVSSVYRKGKELFGKIDFSKEAWDLIEKAGAKYLSIGINPEGKFISEVSIVQHPRVTDARIFSSDLPFGNTEKYSSGFTALLEENRKLKNIIADIKAEEKCRKYIEEGKLTPANTEMAKEIFKCDTTVKFNSETCSLSFLFESFLKTLSDQTDFSELKKSNNYNADNYSEEQMEFAKKIGADLGGIK